MIDCFSSVSIEQFGDCCACVYVICCNALLSAYEIRLMKCKVSTKHVWCILWIVSYWKWINQCSWTLCAWESKLCFFLWRRLLLYNFVVKIIVICWTHCLDNEYYRYFQIRKKDEKHLYHYDCIIVFNSLI